MKRKLALILALVMLAMAFATPAYADPSAWVNTSVDGLVTADTPAELKDDFNLYINKDWTVATALTSSKPKITAFTEIEDTVLGQLKTLLEGEPHSSHEGRLAQVLYKNTLDMEHRNALGIEPIMPYLREIEAISTLDELSAYLIGMRLPDEGLQSFGVYGDINDSTRNVLYLGSTRLSLSDADEYKSITPTGERRKQANTLILQKMLARFGYAQQDIDALIARLFDIETKIAQRTMGRSDAKQENYSHITNNPVTIDELKALSPNFPVAELLERLGVERCILQDKGWLAVMNELYTPENLDGFKAMLIYTLIVRDTDVLDQEAFDVYDEMQSIINGMEYHTDYVENAFLYCSGYLDMAIGKMFAENFSSAEIKQDVENIVAEVIAGYKERLQSADWLSAETREKAIEKLDALRVRVAYPDDWTLYDYSSLDFKTFEEGGSLFEDYLAVKEYLFMRAINMLKPDTVNHELWNCSPQAVNAYYSRTDNSINIPAGILNGVFYDPTLPHNNNLGTIGFVIGHEISHAFDDVGSLYDAKGNLNNWWTEEDRAAFDERTQKLEDYFSSIEALPGVHVDGQLVSGEVVADMGAMSCLMTIASHKPDFDYESFFLHYAKVWRNKGTDEIMMSLLLTNPHPPAYLRTNAVVQQAEEFYTTFGIDEGDGMYLAPEDRVAIW